MHAGFSLKLHMDPAQIYPNEILALYISIYQLEVHTSTDTVLLIMEKLQEQSDKIPEDEKHNIASFLINFAIQKIQTSDLEIHQKLLYQLYKWMIEQNLIAIDRFILSKHFKNIINIYLHFGYIHEARNIFEKYLISLAESEREDAGNYNLALILFYEKHFGKVIDMLTQKRFSNKVYKLAADLLKICTAYELGEFEGLDNAVHAAKKYVSRAENISESAKKRYQNFLSIMDLLIRDKDVDSIALRLDTSDIVYRRPWLEEKIEELRKS